MNIDRLASEENNGIDSISNLLDDVRTHILSFLSTKEAVQTCILSKRWINTWASVPDLKFDIEEFAVLVFGPMIPADKMDVEFVTKIELVLRSVLEKRETSCVNRFQLRLDSDYFLPWTRNLADCIGDVMNLGPRECLLEIGLCENLNLNMDVIFTCASLIHLQLCLSTQFDVFVAIELSSVNLPCLKTLNLKGVMLSIAIEPNSVNLACLKTLNLDGVTMSDNFFKKLLLGCPLLEELVLEDCNISIIEICSNTLKKFFIFSHDVMKLQISTPNLLYLDIFVIAIGEIMLPNMPSLVDASIYIPGWYDEDIYITRGPKLFHSLSNVESLRLQFDFPVGKVQKKDFSSYPVFNNLRCLKFVIWHFHVFDLAPYFLHHSPKLQELTLTNRLATVTEFVDEEITQEGPGDALVQREFLKTIRIVGFKNDNELVDRLINKLLAHVKIIGNIVIDP